MTKQEEIAVKVREILEILGLDTSDPSLAKTPDRVAQMYVHEIFDGLNPDNFPEISHFEENLQGEQVVTIKEIAFVSFCEHHLIPMMGKATISYIPDKKLLGFSKIHQIVRYFAHRPQLQERLTTQIADCLSSLLEIESVAVSLTATHFCVIARAGEDQASTVQTSICRGQFKKSSVLFGGQEAHDVVPIGPDVLNTSKECVSS